MDHVSILRLIAELRRRHGELEGVEAKAAHTGTPADLFKPLSAFANHAGGGILLFGLDEDAGFKAVGVGNPRKLQEDLSGLAAQMEPPLRPSFSVEEIEGGTVVAVEVPEVAFDQKPCYHRPHHLQEGSFIRVGNSTRRMSDYEIYSFVSSRTQPKFDAEPILEATLEDLDRGKLEEYLAQQRKARPNAPYWSLPFEQILKQLRIVIETDGTLRPTLAGLLMFGSYPQRFEQQMVVVFLQFYGTTTTEEAPSGERFLDNRKFEGTVKEIIDNATDYVMAGMRKGSLIRGVTRQDIYEYPEVALREAIVNALAHRDYSHFVRGSHIQVRMFADRLEVQNPGGLYGGVTIDELKEGQSTRNLLLVQLMEDVHLVENRGSGIDAMLDAMQKRGLPAPVFEDKRTAFLVKFYQKTPVEVPLTEEEQRILAYVRKHGSIRRADAQELLGANEAQARYLLQKMQKAGQLRKEGRYRDTRYFPGYQ
ncbi:MAG: ATP-binding protein [Methanothrix sp.]